MSHKRKRTIDLTGSKTSSAFDPRMLLNPRAMLRKQESSPEKELSAANAIEALHKVKTRGPATMRKAKKKDEDDEKSKSAFTAGSGIIGKDMQEAAAKQIELSRGKNAVIIDVDDFDDDYELAADEVQVKAASKSEKVCFGMLKSTVNAFALPEAQSLLPDRWPAIDCELTRGNGMILHVSRKGKRFGVVSSETAAPVSRLLQLDLVSCTCRVPSRPRYAKDVQNQGSISSVLPFELLMYGEALSKERISTVLSQKNCFLIQPTNYDQQYAYVNPHIRQSFKVAGASSQYGTSHFRTAEEIKSEIETLFHEIEASTTLKEHPTPDYMATQLLKHQRQALTFCLTHEDDRPELSVWRETTKVGRKIWRNKITPQVLYTAPLVARGGLICDEMGLGKTLTMLALINATLKEAASYDNSAQRVKCSLIVCPLSVLSNWLDQAELHIGKHKLKILVHHDRTRSYEKSHFRKHDIVLTTYATIANEFKHKADSQRETILPSLDFFRIVLDEAHTIKEVSTLACQAAIDLKGRNRWGITATPVQNTLNDLAALFSFLQIDPFHNRAIWNQYISQPMKSGDTIAVTRLRTLLKMRALRRTKEQGGQDDALMKLLPMREEIRTIKLEKEEQDLYNSHLERYQRQSKTLSTMNALQSINILRQLCLSPALVKNDNETVKTEFTDQELEEIASDQTCAVCHAPIEYDEQDAPNFYMPKCLHFFCSEHGYLTKQTKCSAAECHSSGPMQELIAAKKTKKTVSKKAPYSTKIKALITDLCAIRDSDDPEGPIKSIVFSQFTTFLDLIGYALDDLGLSYARLDGTMSRDMRASETTRFAESSETRIFLVSTRAGGLGLNLTMASRVFMMDPSYNPAADEQALARTHRISQRREVDDVEVADPKEKSVDDVVEQ